MEFKLSVWAGLPQSALHTLTDGLCLTGSKPGSVFSGVENSGIPSIRAQITGGKIIVCCDVKD